MNLWNEHVAYLKDNPEGYWFKGKLYGFGWTPAKPAGWVVTFLYIAVILLLVILFQEEVLFVGQDQNIFFRTLVVITLLFLVVVWKTGEPLKWRWGRGHGSRE